MTQAQDLGARDALVGHTGFVGAALAEQHGFAHRFNSATIAGIDGLACGTLVCAAAPGSMLEANRAPERDRAAIEGLIARLETVRAERCVLISSIAVLADFAGGDDEATDRFQQNLAYGRHRRMLEAFVEAHFPQSLIMRLPALFGPRLRKNFLFDLMNPVPAMLPAERHAALVAAVGPGLAEWAGALYAPDPATGLLKLDRARLDADPRRSALERAVEQEGFAAVRFHHPDTTYQYYGIDRLWHDISIALKAGLTHIHLVSEPLRAADIHLRLTGRPMPETSARLHQEDMRTRHAALWGASGPYQFSAPAKLERLADFYANARVPA
jgi:hypothetical protein